MGVLADVIVRLANYIYTCNGKDSNEVEQHNHDIKDVPQTEDNLSKHSE